MCARYTLTKTDPAVLMAEFGIAVVPPVEPHYNIAPTMDSPIVMESRDGERHLSLARFGLVPFWADDVKIGTRFLNARLESLADKPAFRDAFARHRCLVVADGFYEWRREGKLKVPHYFHLGGRPFGIAGLWSVWKQPRGGRVLSFTIVTCDAEGKAAAIHDRMPVIVKPERYDAWLDRGLHEPDDLLPLLEDHRALELQSYEVSRRVNNVKNDDPECIVPA